MSRFIARRIFQALLAIFGVMILTFLLFRVVAGDIAAAHLGVRATETGKAAWRHIHGYDLPLVVNIHTRLRLTDRTSGDQPLLVQDADKGDFADRLTLLPSDKPDERRSVLLGRFLRGLNRDTPIDTLALQSQRDANQPAPARTIRIRTANQSDFVVDCSNVANCGELLDRINEAADNRDPNGLPLVVADLAAPTMAEIVDSQFFRHLRTAVLFQSRSLTNNKKLTEIIAQRAPKSLALTIPAMALGWFGGMIVSCFVAYFRGRLIDKVGVFLSVLGMCVPFLAFMIYGQWLMFKVAPQHAFGLASRANIYVPVVIMVIAGLGGSVRFYRTVILDEVHRDYVRTAHAKGVSLTSILFKHVLKNCMLPILTNLILSIPFLIMGSLLVESYFGIPGLGDLLITSINGRDEPIMTGLVFLTALVYTIGLLLTDLSYAVFDPRIRLR